MHTGRNTPSPAKKGQAAQKAAASTLNVVSMEEEEDDDDDDVDDDAGAAIGSSVQPPEPAVASPKKPGAYEPRGMTARSAVVPASVIPTVNSAASYTDTTHFRPPAHGAGSPVLTPLPSSVSLLLAACLFCFFSGFLVLHPGDHLSEGQLWSSGTGDVQPEVKVRDTAQH